MTAGDSARGTAPRTRVETAAVIGAVALGLIVIWAFRFRGWYPHDEGLLGQSAERILRGQVPHRDFDDPYTGGLALLHSLVFRLGGISVNALRSHLALVTTIWFGGMFWLLTRWLPMVGAAVVAALIATLGVPLYPAAMPSWYVLFLACAAGGVLVMQPQRLQKAAFFAGALVGLAALAKVTAIFALAGAAWGIVVLRQSTDRNRRGAPEIVMAAGLFVFLVIRLVSSLPTPRVISHIAVPPVMIVIAIAVREIRQGKERGFGIDTMLWRQVAALVAGAALPLAIYCAWLIQNDALAPFFSSLTAVVGRRSAFASLPPPSVRSILYAVPLAAILFAAGRRFGIRSLFLAAGGLTLGVLAWFYPYVHADFWLALRGLLPLGAVVCAGAWVAGTSLDMDSIAARVAAVFIPLTAMMVLTQFPFAAPVYFLYVLPLLIVAVAGVVAMRPAATQRSGLIVAALYLVFGLVQSLPGSPGSLSMSADHSPDLAWLNTSRARIRVPSEDAELYQRLAAALDSVPPGPIWAGPDAPEVAFLSARIDLNREFFAALGRRDPAYAQLAARILAAGGRVVVVDAEPSFSEQLPAEATDSIARYFPHMREVQRFKVYWRSDSP